MHPWLQGVSRLLARDAGLFKEHPKLLGAFLAMTLVPALYTFIYISSSWDPIGQLSQLPVALVNADRGAVFESQPLNIGKRVTDNLLATPHFRYTVYPSAGDAKWAIDRGDAYFALVIPENLTISTLPGKATESAHLELYLSEGSSYMAATIARRFGSEVTRNLNESLGEKRWDIVFSRLALMKEGVGRLKSGASQLNEGLGRLDAGAHMLSRGLTQASSGSALLAQGAGKVSNGVGALTTGMTKLGGGIRTMAGQLPADSDLKRLSDGGDRLENGSRQLSQGLDQLNQAAATLSAKTAELSQGLGRIKDGSGQIHEGSERLASGLGWVPVVGPGLVRLHGGTTQLDGGLSLASKGSQKLAAGSQLFAEKLGEADRGGQRLAEGASQLNPGVQRLTGGVQRLSGAIRTMAQKLPAQEKVDQLKAGSRTLAAKSQELSSGLERLHEGGDRLALGADQAASGSGRLAQGLETLYQKIPSSQPAPSEETKRMVEPVSVTETLVTAVPNNGTAFAPYYLGLSLWIGAVLTTFLFPYLLLPGSLSETRQGARMLAKAVLPIAMVSCQALVVGLVITLGFHIHVPNLLGFYAVLLAGSLTFQAIVMTLILLLGDAGRLLAVVSLVFQLAAAGGPYPIELSPAFFQHAHPFLPFTNLLKALRANLFGAYEGHWPMFAGRLLLAGAIALALAWSIGRFRWKVVAEEAYAAPIDL